MPDLQTAVFIPVIPKITWNDLTAGLQCIVNTLLMTFFSLASDLIRHRCRQQHQRCWDYRFGNFFGFVDRGSWIQGSAVEHALRRNELGVSILPEGKKI